MLVIYTTPGCASCRKAKQWLKDHEIEYIEKNFFTTLLKEKELKFLLKRTQNGTDELISKNSKVLKESNINIDEMNVSDLIRFMQENPSIIKRPIILDEENMLVGYDEDDITIFSKGKVKTWNKKVCSQDCPNYQYCGKIREEDK